MRFDEFTIEYAGVGATLSPERGGIVTGLRVRNTQILYLDRPTFEDETKNVRGGIPILFPFAGKLENDKFLPAGTVVRQHGFARDMKWDVTARSESQISFSLGATRETKAIFPYDFHLDQTCIVVPDGLHVELLVANRGGNAMPISPGWHPYFPCRDAAKREIAGDVAGFVPGKFTEKLDTGFGLPAPQDGRASFTIPDLGRISLRFSPEMRHLQFWTLPGQDFVCIEPFVGAANSINTPARIDLAPGTSHVFWMRVELLK